MTSDNLHETLVLIPARMASTRLPGKPLADICGLPMIVQVALRAKDAAGHDGEGHRDGRFMRGYLWTVKKTTRVWRVPGMRWLRVPMVFWTSR